MSTGRGRPTASHRRGGDRPAADPTAIVHEDMPPSPNRRRPRPSPPSLAAAPAPSGLSESAPGPVSLFLSPRAPTWMRRTAPAGCAEEAQEGSPTPLPRAAGGRRRRRGRGLREGGSQLPLPGAARPWFGRHPLQTRAHGRAERRRSSPLHCATVGFSPLGPPGRFAILPAHCSRRLAKC